MNGVSQLSYIWCSDFVLKLENLMVDDLEVGEKNTKALTAMDWGYQVYWWEWSNCC